MSAKKVYKPRKGTEHLTQYPEEIEKLKKIFETEIESKYEKPLSKSSIVSYVNKINKVSNLLLGHGFNGDFKFLDDAEKVIKTIEESDLSSKKDYLSGVVKILKHRKGTKPEVIAEYQKGMANFKNAEYSLRKDNKATKKQKSDFIPLEEIRKKIEDYKPKDDMELIYKLICAFYFEGDLVPRNDLGVVKFVSSSKKPSSLNKDFNYIVLDKAKNPIKLIWNRYKSDNTYGQQKFEIPPNLKKILKEYIDTFGKQNGDFLFLMRDGETPFAKTNFLDIIGNATEEVLGKRLGVDTIRTIQISDFYNTELHSINEEEEDARRYLHSKDIHKEYLKRGLAKEDV